MNSFKRGEIRSYVNALEKKASIRKDIENTGKVNNHENILREETDKYSGVGGHGSHFPTQTHQK